MAFSASHIEITLRYTNLGQQCQTARVYSWDGAAIAAASAQQLGESWWNHYKTAWRAMVAADADLGRFISVLVREVGGSLSYGEYSIPTGEQIGTRTGSFTHQMPSYVAVGCRLTVGSAVTRPGQMRIPFMNEIDSEENSVGSTFLALCDTLATLYSEPNTLGAPTATGVITPNVVTWGADNNTIAASQEINGYVLNPFVTSQVSRRYGHGN